jgi:type IV secretion system protein VirD4
MAEAMVTRTGEEKEPYWNDQAANVIAGLTAFIASALKPEERNLGSLRELISQAELCSAAVSAMREKGGVFARLAGVIAQLQDKEKAGVFSTVHRHTTFLDSEAIMASVSNSSFDTRELLKGNMTIYLVLPPHQLEAQSRFLRLIIASLIRLVGKEGMQDGKELLMILDEAGQLGHMSPIDQGLTLLRSYGLKMAFFFQSVGQLKSVFRDKECVLLDNTEQVFFGVNSLETAERVSKTLGSATIMLEDASQSTSWQIRNAHQISGNVNHSTSRNWKEHGRELLKPDEVLNMHGDYLVAFLRGIRPIICRRVKWYQDAAFAGGRPQGPVPVVFWLLLAGAVGLLAWQVWAVMGR